MKNIFDDFLDFSNQVLARDSLPEEDVMLHIRARGLLQTSRGEIVKIVLLGAPLGWLIDLLSLPFKLILKHTKSLTITSILVFIVWYFFSISTAEIFFLTLCLLALLNLKLSTNWLKCFVFDLADILSYGSCTKGWLKIYFSQSRLHKNWVSEVSSPLTLHIFVSRQLWSYNPILTEEKEFFDKTDEVRSDHEKIKKFVDEYWSIHGK